MDMKTDSNEANERHDGVEYNKCAACTSKADDCLNSCPKKVHYFYKAPIVKFCCHSVTTGSLSDKNLLLQFV